MSTQRGPAPETPTLETHTQPITRQSNHPDRTALDAPELILEVGRMLDAIDIVLMAAAENRGITEADARGHVLTMHGKCRLLLGAAVVGVN